MFCPECSAEYVPGVSRCYDCDVPLVDAMPQAEPEMIDLQPPGLSPDDRARAEHLELVTVLASHDPGLMAVAKSMLQSAGIRFVVEGEGVQDLFGLGRLGFNPITGPAALRVRADEADDARVLLAELVENGDSG